MRLIAFVLATAIPLAAGMLANGWAQVLPGADFAARDGRPGPGKKWKIDDASGTRLAAELSAIAAKTPISIDYEHQTLRSETNGQPAPASGWMLGFEWRAGDGLWARVRWTDRARGLIDAEEYKYISPVILATQDGRIVGIHNAALVGTPAILGMEAVSTALAATALQHEFPPATPTAPKESRMDLATLIALLGLAAGATAQDVTAHLTALMARPVVPAALATALGLQAGSDEATTLAALQRRLGTPDAATLQVVSALQSQVAALSAQIAQRQVNEVVDAAIAAHKLLPAQRDWAIKLGTADLVQLNAFVAATPPIAGLAGQGAGGRDPAAGGTTTALSDSQTLIATQLGLDPKAYLAALNAAA